MQSIGTATNGVESVSASAVHQCCHDYVSSRLTFHSCSAELHAAASRPADYETFVSQ